MALSFPQLSYPLAMSAAVAGLPDGLDYEAETVILEGNSDWGLGVCVGAGGFGYGLAPGASTDLTVDGKFLGFAIRQEMKEPRDPRYKATDAIPVMRKGRIWIPVAHTVADGVKPYIIYSGAGIGSIRDDADTNKAAQASGVRVRKGAATGGLALVEVNLAI